MGRISDVIFESSDSDWSIVKLDSEGKYRENDSFTSSIINYYQFKLLLLIDDSLTFLNELGKLTSTTLGISIIISLSFHFDTFHYHNSGIIKTVTVADN